MSTKSIYQILEEVATTSSKNEKEFILKQHTDNVVLKEVFRLTYSPTIKYYISSKTFPVVWEQEDFMNTSWDSVFETLEEISSRKVTGHNAIDLVMSTLNSVDFQTADVMKRIILGDLKIGCKENTINKVWKGLIVKPPRLGAASMNEKSLKKLHSIKNLAVELKSDGSYAASICGEESTMMSRNGNPLDIECLQTHLSCGAFNGFALEGELVYSLDKATREDGNGTITKIVKGTASESEKDNALYQIWDCINVNFYHPKSEWKVSNQERRKLLEGMMERYTSWCHSVDTQPKIHLIEREEFVSVERAFEVFEQYVRNSYEGAIVKDMDASWKDVGKPAFNIKLKRKETADLKVVGIFMAEEGSKYDGMLGGFICESECGEIKVRVGSGFNDEDRVKYITEQPPVIEVEYDSITEDKKTKQKSLFLPIFKRPRYDKDIADTLDEIKDKVRIK